MDRRRVAWSVLITIRKREETGGEENASRSAIERSQRVTLRRLNPDLEKRIDGFREGITITVKRR